MHHESEILGEGGKPMRKHRITAVMAAMFCMILMAGCGNSKAVQEQQMTLRSQGMEQAKEGDYEAAVASYDEALGLSDMYVGNLEMDIAAYKASALYAEGNTEDAIAACSAVLDVKKSQEMYLTRGLLYRAAENREAANADFASAMGMTSKKDKIMLGRLSYYMEDYTNAKSYLETAVKEGNTEGIYWQAQLYNEMGNPEYAITLYQNYLNSGNVKHQDAYEKVASWQLDNQDYDGAASTLEAGISMGNGGCLQKLLASEIAVYEYKGDFTTAFQKMETYLESYPDDGDAQREYTFLKTRSEDGQSGEDTEEETAEESTEE